jgi:hypothetical protein
LSDYTLDSRESNQHFCTEALTGQWERTQMKLSTFIILDDDQEDMDCGDFTNENRDGIVEFKEFGDFVNSTINSKHLWEQVIKMYSTGFPFCVIVYGNEYAFLKRSSVSATTVRRAKQKLFTMSSDYKFPVKYSANEKDALEDAITWLEKCRRLPRGWPSRDLLPHPNEVLFKGWGYSKVARFFKNEETNTMANLIGSALLLSRKEFIMKYDAVPGLAETTIGDFYDRCNTDLGFEKEVDE